MGIRFVLTRGLDNLRDQVNERWPNRDEQSDGTLGDTAHMSRTSGHNVDDTAGSKPAWDADADYLEEVRAWDQDADLREAGSTAQEEVDHIRKLPGLSAVLRYIIFNRRIYHARNGFEPDSYTGANPHDKHIHFEGAHSQSGDQNTTYDYRLEEVGDDDMPLTQADKDWIDRRLGDVVPNYRIEAGKVVKASASDANPTNWTHNAVGLANRDALTAIVKIDELTSLVKAMAVKVETLEKNAGAKSG